MRIPLTQGQFAIVDDADFDWLNQWKWHAYWNPTAHSFYAMRNSKVGELKKRRVIRMHAAIIGHPGADHKNRNGLDNQRQNLRVATKSQNAANSRLSCRNTSGIRGVHWDKIRCRWRVEICFDGVRHALGRFLDLKEAVRAYNEAAIKFFGEYAQLNKTQNLWIKK